MSRLPNLASLRAFAAVARAGSINAAADALSVTQSAVSHQMRGLEADLGVELTRREGRGVALTDAGKRLADPLLRGFDLIERAVSDLRLAPNAPLVVSVEPTFAARWLVSRLLKFRKSHPEITLHVEPTYELADFARDRVDLAIRAGHGEWPGLVAERITRARIVPMAAPGFLRAARIRAPSDLAGVHLISDDDGEYWQAWLDGAGLTDVDEALGPHLDDTNLAIAAAAAGQGVALVYEDHVAAELADGRLTHVFADEVEMDFSYFVVHPAGMRLRSAAAAFKDWLLAEAASDQRDG